LIKGNFFKDKQANVYQMTLDWLLCTGQT